MSVQKLSNPNEEPLFDKRMFDIELSSGLMKSSNLIAFHRDLNAVEASKKNDWQEIIKKRLEQKTKMKKTPNRQVKVAKTKENKFSDVYGYFFFPLLNPYDRLGLLV
jgi:hypothetical protein